jgi:hypothetical protein
MMLAKMIVMDFPLWQLLVGLGVVGLLAIILWRTMKP